MITPKIILLSTDNFIEEWNLLYDKLNDNAKGLTAVLSDLVCRIVNKIDLKLSQILLPIY